MRLLTPFCLLSLAGPVALSAQTSTTPLCYHARPRPACSAFVFTSFGSYLLLGRDVFGSSACWLSASASVEVAVGTPLVSSSGDIQPGSLFGLAKWSPNDWFSVAARPELARWTSVTSCGPAGCATASRMHGRMSVGIEFGRAPGAVLTGLSGVATYLAFLAIAYSD